MQQLKQAGIEKSLVLCSSVVSSIYVVSSNTTK